MKNPFKFEPNCDPLFVTCQVTGAMIASVVFEDIFTGIQLSAFLVSMVATFLLRDTLAPSGNFWQYRPNQVAVGIALLLLVLGVGFSIFSIPHSDWLFWLLTVVAATITGLGLVRKGADLLPVIPPNSTSSTNVRRLWE